MGHCQQCFKIGLGPKSYQYWSGIDDSDPLPDSFLQTDHTGQVVAVAASHSERCIATELCPYTRILFGCGTPIAKVKQKN